MEGLFCHMSRGLKHLVMTVLIGRGRMARWAGVRRLDGVGLVAGEEIRSREAGQGAEMAARHLVLIGAAHGTFAALSSGVGGGEERSHGKHTCVCR